MKKTLLFVASAAALIFFSGSLVFAGSGNEGCKPNPEAEASCPSVQTCQAVEARKCPPDCEKPCCEKKPAACSKAEICPLGEKKACCRTPECPEDPPSCDKAKAGSCPETVAAKKCSEAAAAIKGCQVDPAECEKAKAGTCTVTASGQCPKTAVKDVSPAARAKGLKEARTRAKAASKQCPERTTSCSAAVRAKALADARRTAAIAANTCANGVYHKKCPPMCSAPCCGGIVLFDGKTLEGWIQRGGKARYEVVDGMIVGTSVPKTPNSFLCTEQNYADFILNLDFKVNPKLNSGIQIRSNSLEDYKRGRVHGYQVEIDPKQNNYKGQGEKANLLEDGSVAEGAPRSWTGGIYDEGRRGWLNTLAKNPKARAAFKSGKWNHLTVVAKGDSIKTFINGVAAADLKDDMTKTGFIGLQVHSTGSLKPLEVRWKNISLKDLSPSPKETEVSYDLAPDTVRFNKAGVPSDAVVLFDGTDLSQWQSVKGGDAKWKVENGYFEVVKKTGGIKTRQPFGSCQLHIEWSAPEVVKGNGQGRGNSGVFLMERYEVQILDSFENKTYPNGQAGSIYKQSIPLANACKGPGKWESYDIIFHAPEFEDCGCVKPATMTVLHNGVLIQDHFTLTGPTRYRGKPEYSPHADKMSIMLQDHGNPVRFRNIWIREL